MITSHLCNNIDLAFDMNDFSNIKKELIEEYENILNYWSKHTLDNEFGGFIGEVNPSNTQIKDADKGVVLNARILWTFSSAYNFLKDEKYLIIAKRAFDYLVKQFWDKDYEGVFWSLTYDGQVLDGRKQIYAQGFAIYGLSEYYKATNDKEALSYSIKLFQLIENYSFDNENGGYLEALARNWEPLEDMRLSLKDDNQPKSMNTHLHIIEPYANLYRVWPDAILKEKIKGLINIFLDKIIDSKTFHFNLFFDMDWSVKSNLVSYGHDIEGAWLLCEAAEVIDDEELLEKVYDIAIKMTDVTIEQGLANDGSLLYEKDLTEDKLDTDRHWWVQAEAMVGLVNAWQITKKTSYLDKMIDVWCFITNNQIDHKSGEWFLRIDDDGKHIASDEKAGFWKCPYHNTRALMEVYNRLK